MLRTIHLHGRLGKRFGKRHILAVSSPAEAVRALGMQNPGFLDHIRKGRYEVRIGDLPLGEDQLTLSAGRERHIHITPAAAMAGIETILLIGLAIVTVATVAFTFLAMPKPPKPGDRENATKQDSFIFDGPVNSTEQGHPVPVVYGRMRVGSVVASAGIATTDLNATAAEADPGHVGYTAGVGGGIYGREWTNVQLAKGGGGGKGGGSQRSAQEDPNTLQSQALARVVDIVSEGEIVGLVDGLKSIYFDSTPVQNPDDSFNFAGLTVEERLGLPDQTPMPGFSQTENSYAIDAPIKQTTGPVVRRLLNDDADVCRVTIGLPRLFKQDTTNGDLKQHSVEIAIDYQSNNGGFTEVLTHTFSGKTNSPYQRSFDIRLTGPGPHDIRVRRLSPDAELASIEDSTNLDLLTEIVEAKLIYPDTALFGLSIDARQFGTNIPTRSYEIKGLIIEVPTNYNPETRTYTGIWDGTFKRAWTDNPAWIYRDIIVNRRYGLGRRIPETAVDKWGLYAISQHCDELVPDGQGGQQPRYTLNVCIKSAEGAYDVLASIAGAFRGWVFWGSGSIIAEQDRPEDPSVLVAPANVVDGKISYDRITPLEKRRSVVIMYWNDPEDGYRLTPEIVERPDLIARFGWRPGEDLTAYGCTNRAEARRKALWVFEDEDSGNTSASYQVGDDHSFVSPGRIAEIADPRYSVARRGGRVKAASANSVTIDAPFTIEAGRTYTLGVTLPNGTVSKRAITNAAGAHTVINLGGAAYAAVPIAGAIWTIESDQIANRQFRVRAITTDEAPYSVRAISHDPNKFARVEQGRDLPEVNFLVPIDGPLGMPSEIKATEFLLRDGNSASPAIRMSWTAAADPRVSGYQAQYRRPGDGWTALSDGLDLGRDIRNSEPGVWGFRVRAVDSLGRRTAWLEATITIAAATEALPNVTGLSIATDDVALTAALRWTAPVDVRPLRFEIMRAATNAFASAVSIGETDQREWPITEPGHYWVRTAFMAERSAAPPHIEATSGLMPNPQWGRIDNRPMNLSDLDATAAFDLNDVKADVADLITTYGSTASAAASASAAQGYASAAQTAASNAATANSNAQSALTGAQTARDAAIAQANAASGSASAAAGSATTATNQANAAAGSASSASGSATVASTKAGEASVSASQAASSASGAAGSASAAQTSAVSASNSAASAIVTVAASMPADFGEGGRFFAMLTGSEETASTPEQYYGYVSYPVTDQGRVMHFSSAATGYNHVAVRKRIPVSSHARRYRITAKVRQMANPSSGICWATLSIYGLTADYNLIVYGGFLDLYEAAPSLVINNNITVADGIVTLGVDFSLAANPVADGNGNTAAFAVPSLYFVNAQNNYGVIGQPEIISMKVEDVTESYASGLAASAAATSASNAAISATNAGSSASAAQTSATNASTSAGNAQTYANQASTSATNAAGSASTASTQATNAANSASAAAGSASAASGSASTAATQATNAANSASAAMASQVSASSSTAATYPSGFADPSQWINHGGWGGTATFSGGKALTSGAASIRSTWKMPVDPAKTYKFEARYKLTTIGAATPTAYIGPDRVNSDGTDFGIEAWVVGGAAYVASAGTVVTVSGTKTGAAIINGADVAAMKLVVLVGYPYSDSVGEIISASITDITESTSAASSASAAASSASSASTSAGSAGASATSASNSANTASIQASNAATSASAASGSAASASSSASSAATSASLSASYSAKAQANAQAVALTPNARFQNGMTGWYGDTAGGGLYYAPYGNWIQSANGASGVWANNAGNFSYIYSELIPIDPSRKYKIRGRVYSSGGGGIIYIGATSHDANGTTIGANAGQNYIANWSGNTKAAGWHDIESQVLTGAGANADDANWFRAGTKQVRVLAFLNYGNIDAAQVFQLDSLWIEDVTDLEAASSYAGIASTQASVATASAAAAQASAVLSASIGPNLRVRNPVFADWPNPAATPANWTHSYGSTAMATRIAGDTGNYAYDVTVGAAGQHELYYTEGPGSIGPGWYVMELDIEHVSGNWQGAGCRLYVYDQYSNYLESNGINVASDTDIAGTVLGYTPAARRYYFRKLCQFTNSAIKQFYFGFSGGGLLENKSATGREIIRRAGFRPATPSEIRDQTVLAPMQATVSTQSAAITTLQGEAKAYWQVEGNAGTEALFFISARARAAYGDTPTSSVSFGAREVHIYNPAGANWKKALSVFGGNVVLSGGLTAGAFIRLGSGEGWPVALQARDFLAADGDTVSFGTTLDSLPKLDFDDAGLAALGSGETYNLYAENLTTTGFTARLKIATPGGTTNYSKTASTTPGTGPTIQIDKGADPDSDSGDYTFSFSGTVTVFNVFYSSGGGGGGGGQIP